MTTERRTRSASTIVAAVLLVVVAAAAAGCGPSLDPAAKADIDRRIAALQPPAATFPGPTGFLPMPLAVGQWTQHKMVNEKGEPSFMTYKIVGEDAGAFWIEAVIESYTGKTIQKMLVAFGNRMDPAQIEIRDLKMRDAKGNVSEIPPGVIGMMQGMYKGVVSGLVVNWQGMPQEAAVVPAGRFDGCYRARTEVSFGTFRSVSDGWSHTSVPISGMVKSQGVDRPVTMELVAFGTTGATSELP